MEASQLRRLPEPPAGRVDRHDNAAGRGINDYAYLIGEISLPSLGIKSVEAHLDSLAGESGIEIHTK